MSPSESRSGSNPNRVRIFGPDKLVRAAAEKRWDRVKIVCSQPYSKVPRVRARGVGSLVLGKERAEGPVLSCRGLGGWGSWSPHGTVRKLGPAVPEVGLRSPHNGRRCFLEGVQGG